MGKTIDKQQYVFVEIPREVHKCQFMLPVLTEQRTYLGRVAIDRF
jgi:hypothetical protein